MNLSKNDLKIIVFGLYDRMHKFEKRIKELDDSPIGSHLKREWSKEIKNIESVLKILPKI
jgi:hypothetical protein